MTQTKPGSYDPSLDMPIALRNDTRSYTKHSMCNSCFTNLSPKFKAFTARPNTARVLKNIHEAMERPEWKTVVIEEMGALEKNKTLYLCTLPKGHKPVRCKYVSTLKYNSDRTLDRYKARLVAKSFTQTYKVDTFSPMEKLNTIKVFLCNQQRVASPST